MVRVMVAIIVAGLWALPAFAAETVNGEQVFKKRCSTCHNPTEVLKIGPGLKGVFGREAKSGIGILNEARLHEWLKSPRAVKSGTRMPTYREMEDMTTRQAVIDYLKTL